MEPQRTSPVVAVAVLFALGLVAVVVSTYMSRREASSPAYPPIPALEASSTPKERLDYAAAVTDRSVEADTIVLTECRPEPLYARIPVGSSVAFKNIDQVARTVSFSPALIYSVPAGGEVVVEDGMFKYRGLWPYSCDSQSSGTIVVIQ